MCLWKRKGKRYTVDILTRRQTKRYCRMSEGHEENKTHKEEIRTLRRRERLKRRRGGPGGGEKYSEKGDKREKNVHTVVGQKDRDKDRKIKKMEGQTAENKDIHIVGKVDKEDKEK